LLTISKATNPVYESFIRKSKKITMSTSKDTQVPYRQIRATYDSETITVYQAYSSAIATAAVKAQKLSASPDFSLSRMTWIKPSFCWMMYRSGYGTKDPRQSHILALKLSHANFDKLLSQAVVCHGQTLSEEEKKMPVRVQWDPERGPGLEVLGHRSLQVGIGGSLSKTWIEWVVGIEDVTEMAGRLREVVEQKRKEGEKLSREELVQMRCLPEERVYEVSEELRKVLMMDEK
jgi:hypothetical protein